MRDPGPLWEVLAGSDIADCGRQRLGAVFGVVDVGGALDGLSMLISWLRLMSRARDDSLASNAIAPVDGAASTASGCGSSVGAEGS